jgi:two-component system response regulator NreC
MTAPFETIIRIAITDDNTVLRQSLKIALNNYPKFNVVLDTANGNELLDKLNVKSTDILLLDLDLALMNGFELLKKLSVDYPETKCLILSYMSNPEFVINALQFGAKGFIAKDDSLEMLQKAIEKVYEGMLFLNRHNSQILDKFVTNEVNSHKENHPFTPKEVAIIRLACAGKTSKEIAEAFEISIKTVENHRSNIFAKAGVKNVAQLVLYAVQEGIIVTF